MSLSRAITAGAWNIGSKLDRHGPMSLLDLAGLDDWIRSKTGVGVIVDTSRSAEGGISHHSSATAAE